MGWRSRGGLISSLSSPSRTKFFSPPALWRSRLCQVASSWWDNGCRTMGLQLAGSKCHTFPALSFRTEGTSLSTHWGRCWGLWMEGPGTEFHFPASSASRSRPAQVSFRAVISKLGWIGECHRPGVLGRMPQPPAFLGQVMPPLWGSV